MMLNIVAGFSPTPNHRLGSVLILPLLSCLLLMVQEAGFEPANRYGLGPHPSAFDQAGRLLRRPSLCPRVYQHRDLSSSLLVEEDGDFIQRFSVNVGHFSILGGVAHGHHEHGFLVLGTTQQFPQEPHR